MRRTDKGNTITKSYWKREETFAETFDKDGWFKTGDIAERSEDGIFKILGRASVDILKVGGFKLSALEIERYILEHPSVATCAVVGVDDPAYGQRIGVVLVLKDKKVILSLDDLRAFLSDKVSSYKLPHRLIVLDEMPQNAMGKVNKKDLVKVFL